MHPSTKPWSRDRLQAGKKFCSLVQQHDASRAFMFEGGTVTWRISDRFETNPNTSNPDGHPSTSLHSASLPAALSKLHGGSITSSDWGELVTVQVGDPESEDVSQFKPFLVHKGVLSFYSDYFMAMFSGAFREATSGVCTLPDVEPALFAATVDWMYHGTAPRLVKISDIEYMVKLVIISDKYRIPGLERAVLKSIHDMPADVIITDADDFTAHRGEQLHRAIDFACTELFSLPEDHLHLLRILAAKLVHARCTCGEVLCDQFDPIDSKSRTVLYNFIAYVIAVPLFTGVVWDALVKWKRRWPCAAAFYPATLLNDAQRCRHSSCIPNVDAIIEEDLLSSPAAFPGKDLSDSDLQVTWSFTEGALHSYVRMSE